MFLYHVAYKISFCENITNITNAQEEILDNVRKQFRINRKRDGGRYTVQTTFYIETNASSTNLLTHLCRDFTEITRMYRMENMCEMEIDICIVDRNITPIHRYCMSGQILQADS